MQITKTDFIQYLKCPKSAWLLKRDPDTYPHGEFSTFLKKITREGYEVERYVKQSFEEDAERAVDFQVTYETEDGLFARIDALEKTTDGECILYEIKSSTSVKTDKKHNHIKDACFQKICAERAGQGIDRVYIVHLNGKYCREGEIDTSAFLTFTDVTDRVAEVMSATEVEIDAALKLLGETDIDRNGCSCLGKSRSNHCDTFALFNPGIPKPSIYSLPRLSDKKRNDFLAKGILDLNDVPDDYPLSSTQEIMLRAAKTNAPQVNHAEIQKFLAGLLFPIYFFDFETYSSAVPLVDRASPHKHIPVQYSLHILGADGALAHKEFLEREARLPIRLIEQMEIDFGEEGSVVSWHASFEEKQNTEMGKWFTDKAGFLNGINSRMVDLEDVFKSSYVDARFDGSTSIKKVLPVVCPELNYQDLEVQDGSIAMETWERLIGSKDEAADEIADNLLRYCERDTFAMVEIYRFLQGL
jgi:hypothetical protein